MAQPLLKLTEIELRLFFRNPRAAFFILAFPLLLLFVFGAIFGNRPIVGQPGGAMDLSVPGYIGMILGTTGLMGVPGWVATYREQGIFRRFRVTPIRPSTLLLAQGIVGFLTSLLGIGLLIVAGRLAFHLRMPAAPLGVLAAIVIGSASIMSIGGMLAAVAGTARSAQAIGMAIYFPMLFLSGSAFPRALMPAGVQRVSSLLPLTHVNELIAGFWLTAQWRPVSLAVLLGALLVAGGIAVRNFRWE
jgi:ABC-2 type transport system permease protein